ncbi:MAG TPA: GNAT family N-acetyltransferase [Chitinophagales bacterium]|nr:GNAT family N-acetyltransferase [Chitinophagales bacterium]HNE45250.1 GNAT family N-acetyltransferase [Chitinophagales bacterium]HNK97300.1 GNAT family N-acetyltransferase [Chitinophagales bacterium]HNM08186.1 GNAT family N-acetyltransferase [Chitinophagales bacterium]HNM29891.1 GNAT family N-acetyltransferase [Chitinophagales bacterium]
MPHQEPISIRLASSADAPLLAKLGAKTFFDTYQAFNTPENMTDYISKNFNINALEAELGDEAVSFFIAFSGDSGVGYIKLSQGVSSYVSENPAMEVSRYYVDAGFQGRKVGAALMQSAFEHAKANNCKVIWLAVWQKNPKAVNIYIHQGFEIIGTTTFQLGDDLQDDYVMAKRL